MVVSMLICNKINKKTTLIRFPFSAATQTTTTAVAPQKQQEPMFISVPPRPQRVFHSEAYIKFVLP